MSNPSHPSGFSRRSVLAVGLLLGAALIPGARASTPPTVPISNVPLTLVNPTHPEVLLVLANSQSMDGDLAGAIMTGSGEIPALAGSSSPVDYSVPAGFTPPCVAANTSGDAPYTTFGSSSAPACPNPGIEYDNSASRLNVAKEALSQVISYYAANFDMGLMDYSTGGSATYTTWLYMMSEPGGFTFGTSDSTPPADGGNWRPNPCYLSTLNSCAAIETYLTNPAVLSDPYISTVATSDNPAINDVLYAGGFPSVFLNFDGPYCNGGANYCPGSLIYSDYTLSDYNNGAISTNYNGSSPNGYALGTNPTNAGYVPHSTQVLYAERGFGFYSSASSTTGNLLVPIESYTDATGCSGLTELQCYIQQFTPYLAPETNDSGSSEIKAIAIQSPVAGVLEGAYNYYTGTDAPVSNTDCAANRYVVLITDGLPTQDLGGGLWPPLGSRSAVGYGETATFNLVGGGTVSTTDSSFANDVEAGLTTTLASTNDQALTDTITKLTDLDDAHIKTYIVGMGAGVDPALNPAAAATLKAMAIAGGTQNYYPGISPEAVTDDLQAIFGAINVNNVATTSASVNSTSLNTSTVVYQAKFDSAALPYADWTGELQAFPVTASGTVNIQSGALWDAAQELDTTLAGTGWNTRPVATWNPAADNGVGAGVPFVWADLSPLQQDQLETLWSSLTVSEQAAFGDNEATYGQAVLDYLLGDTAGEEVNGGIFRDRSALLGDIVDSNPVYVGPPEGTYTDASYLTFAQDLANRTPALYVGANDGMLHAFSATTGQELFAYVPNGVFANLANLTNPTYNQSHEFFVDGSPSAGDVQFSDGSWHTIVTGGLNDGGESIYAINVTHPTQLETASGLASHVLWEFTDPYLGLTYSQPQVARIDLNGSPTSVVIFGSGYDNADGNPYLYVVNAQTGALIDRLSLCSDVPTACNSSKANGLSTPVVVPADGSTLDNLVYAGDLQGNLWRIDISSSSPADWTASVLFQAGSATDPQPITTQPVVSLAPSGAPAGSLLVMFGTGQFLGTPDLTTTTTQGFYGILDPTPAGGTPPSNYPPGYNKLVQQTLSDATYSYTSSTGQTITLPIRTVTNNTIDWSSKDGWYLDLPDAGERVVTNPHIEGGAVIFTSYIPDAASTTSCSTGGSSFLMVLNFATGGAFPGPELDLNGGNTINASDQYNGQNPVGIGLGNGFAAAPTIVRTRPGVIGDIKLVTLSTDTIASWKERGGNRGRLNWKEIR